MQRKSNSGEHFKKKKMKKEKKSVSPF